MSIIYNGEEYFLIPYEDLDKFVGKEILHYQHCPSLATSSKLEIVKSVDPNRGQTTNLYYESGSHNYLETRFWNETDKWWLPYTKEPIMRSKPVKKVRAKRVKKIKETSMVECSVCHNVLPGGYLAQLNDAPVCIKCLRESGHFRCDHCGGAHRITIQVRMKSKDVCSTCAEQHYVPCCRCGNVFSSSEISTHRGKKYCTECYEKYFGECADCRTVYSKAEMKKVEDKFYCGRCYDGKFASCRICGEHHLRSDMQHLEGNWYCAHCNPRCEIRDGSYKPEPNFFGDESPVFLGVELEVECKEIRETIKALDVTEEFYLKHDGSLSSRGVEIVTMPCTLDYHKNKIDWAARCGRLVKAGTKSHQTDTCGLHVHVSSDHLSEFERNKLAWFYYKEMDSIALISRRKSPYGHSAIDPETKIKEITKQKTYRNRARYEVLNWYNPHTVEFRLPKGTLKAATLLATLELCDASVEYIREHTLNVIRKGSFDSFLMWCQSNKRNRKRYSNLIAFFTKKEKCPVLASLKKSAVASAEHFKTEKKEVGLEAGPVIDSDEVEDPRFCRL